MPTITFQPSGKTVQVEIGVTLLRAARAAGVVLSTPCAEKGLCGKCRVKVLDGDVPVDQRQRDCLPEKLLNEGWRASCIVPVERDLVLADPITDGTDVVVLADFAGREPVGQLALWRCDCALEAPSGQDQTDDAARLFADIKKNIELDVNQPLFLPLLRRLPAVLRENNFHCRAVGVDGLLLDVKAPAGQLPPVTGLAVDIGTTTIAAALVDLHDGSVLAISSQANPQSKWGDDVVSRMEQAAKGGGGLSAMQEAVVQAVEDLAEKACRLASAEPPLLAVIAANTVMNHLFLGIPPGGIAVSPFVPAFRCGLTVSAVDAGWRGRTPPLLYIVPNISAYVGGDITAGILAHDLGNAPDIRLLLDVGTNGEIALSVRGTVYACSTAAGPAFEGARIGHGMRASPGAISRVGLARGGDLDIGVIDNRAVAGICGTGLLDAVATLRRAGVIEEYGRILDEDEMEEAVEAGDIVPALADRVQGDGGDRGVRLWPPAGAAGHEVRLTQKDVREFQLAKGAIAAGVRVLAGVADIDIGEIDRVLLAGGFGNYLDARSAVVTGLLPVGIRREAVHSVGNSSLAGARLCLLSPEEKAAADALSRGVHYIELSGRADFQEAFAEEMLFPNA